MATFEATPENSAIMAAVAARLEGTSMSLDDAIEVEFGEGCTIDDCSIPLLQELDGQVMQCEECGWWCPVEDLDEDQICYTCR
jgi:hypothetical protein